MKTRNILSIFIVAMCLLAAKLTAQTVYITDGGKKYHAKNCSIVKTGKKGIELAEAKKQGYEACKACKVDDVTSKSTDKPIEKKVADKPKEAKTSQKSKK